MKLALARLRLSGLCKVIAIILCMIVGLIVTTLPTFAAKKGELRIMIIDRDGASVTSGKFKIYDTSGSMLLQAALDDSGSGMIKIDSKLLTPGATYEIKILNSFGLTIYGTKDWVYDPADFDPGFDPEVRREKFVLAPEFRGKLDKGLEFNRGETINPEWERSREKLQASQVYVETVTAMQGPPRYLLTVFTPLMIGGKFSSDEDAAGGVSSVAPGLSLTLTRRFDYPADLKSESGWIRFKEASVAYALNRYQTNQLLDPGQAGDVSFHRFTAYAGYGWMSKQHKQHVGADLALSYGGIYDGSSVLEYLDRSYNLFGLGVQGRYYRQVFSGGGVDVDLLGQLEIMYYPVDTVDDDFWYGLAPSLAVGVVIH